MKPKVTKATDALAKNFKEATEKMAKENSNCFTKEQYLEVWKSLGLPCYRDVLWARLISDNFVQRIPKKWGWYKLPPSLKTTADDLNRVLNQVRIKIRSYQKITEERKDCKVKCGEDTLEARIKKAIDLLKENGYIILREITITAYEKVQHHCNPFYHIRRDCRLRFT